MHGLVIYLILILIAAICHWIYLLKKDWKNRIEDVIDSESSTERDITGEFERIFSMLDPKSLIVCRKVSKHWRYIATDPKIEQNITNRYKFNARRQFAEVLGFSMEDDIPLLPKYTSGILLSEDEEAVREPKISSSLSDIFFAVNYGKVLVELTEEFIEKLLERLKYSNDEVELLHQKFIFKTISENAILRIVPIVNINSDENVGKVPRSIEDKISVNVTWRNLSLSVDGPRLESIQKQLLWHKFVGPAELIFDIKNYLRRKRSLSPKSCRTGLFTSLNFCIIPISNTLDMILLAMLWLSPMFATVLLVDDNLTASLFNFIIPALVVAALIGYIFFKEYKVLKKCGAFLLTLQVGFNLVKDPLEKMYVQFLISTILYGGYYYAQYIITKRYPLRHKRELITKISILLWIAAKDWSSCFILIQHGLIYSHVLSLIVVYLVICAQILATYCWSAKKIKRDVVGQISKKLVVMSMVIIYLL